MAGAYGLIADELLPWSLVPLALAAAAGGYAAIRGPAVRRVEVSNGTLVIAGETPQSIRLSEVREVVIGPVGYSRFYPRNSIERLTGRLLQFPSIVTITTRSRVLELRFDDPLEAERFARVVRLGLAAAPGP